MRDAGPNKCFRGSGCMRKLSLQTQKTFMNHLQSNNYHDCLYYGQKKSKKCEECEKCSIRALRCDAQPLDGDFWYF